MSGESFSEYTSNFYKTFQYILTYYQYNNVMNIYIEYVVADNMVIDTLLIWMATVTLRIPYKKYRMFLGGAVGTACAVVSVYITGFWTYLFKTACLVLMCIVAVGFGKKLFWHILLTTAYTFVLGGAITGLFNLFNVDYLTSSGEFYQMRVPLFVYVLAVALAGFICYSVVTYVRQVKKISPHLAKIVVKLDKNYNLSGFIDSGNTLTHEGLPVCFVTKNFVGFTRYFAEKTLHGHAVDIEVTTVTGCSTVKAIVGTVICNGIERQVYLALPAQKCQTIYNVILSCEFGNKGV
ncbi:MAG: sigma-E processing peptidase SpoIIGA [Clostridiales bacterium]|nr:sigma-E processing peptidase SpoIIGA [Clostridiales bacterium]